MTPDTASCCKKRTVLEVVDLQKHYPLDGGLFRKARRVVKAVDGISFEIYAGETLGLVGESGCGKTTVGKTILRLFEPTAGKIVFMGQDIAHLRGAALKAMRKGMQFIFQDPYASLNTRMTVGQIVGEPFAIHGIASGAARTDRVKALLERVGLPSQYYHRFPHEFSGGQRQRIGIARALALEPMLVVCDEPVSALDVSIQSQILNLMTELQRERGMAYLFISHGLAAVRHISQRIGVMYLGRLMELADADAIFEKPLHPYTQALLSAIPEPDPERKRERILLEGDVPSPIDPPGGCRFHERCRRATAVCRAEIPAWREIDPGHYTACHLYD